MYHTSGLVLSTLRVFMHVILISKDDSYLQTGAERSLGWTHQQQLGRCWHTLRNSLVTGTVAALYMCLAFISSFQSPRSYVVLYHLADGLLRQQRLSAVPKSTWDPQPASELAAPRTDCLPDNRDARDCLVWARSRAWAERRAWLRFAGKKECGRAGTPSGFGAGVRPADLDLWLKTQPGWGPGSPWGTAEE